MPCGQNDDQVATPTLMQSFDRANSKIHPTDQSNILQSIKKQEAQFEQFDETESIANQLEKWKLSSRVIVPNWIYDENEMSEAHLVYSCMYVNITWIKTSCSETVSLRRVLQEKPSEMPQYHPYSSTYYSNADEERDAPYPPTPGYHQPPAANGGHPRDDPSPNSSVHSATDGHPQLISRTTARHSMQEVHTVTKLIREREVRHIGPDGQPVNYPYGGVIPPPPADYTPYTYNPMHEPPRSDYGTYDSGRAVSPNGQEVPGQEYVAYPVRPHSPGSETGSRRNYERYPAASPHRGAYPDYDPYGRTSAHPADYPAYARQEPIYPTYGNYPVNRGNDDAPDRLPTPPSPTSEGSESPPPQRAMPQAPPGMEYNHHPPPYQTSGYEELDSTVMPPRPPPPEHSDHFRATPSPGAGSDRFDSAGYLDRQPCYADNSPPPHYGNAPRAVFDDMDTPIEERAPLHLHDEYPAARRSLSVDDDNNREVRWRDPDLNEVIEFLGHPNNVVRANAAAYLQHLCYMDDNMKQKSRSLGGIPPLVALLNHEIPEVHRNACGALRNLSYGRQNDENKRAIKNASGIPALVRLLRKTPDNEVRELVTGVLWNLSSCEDLKKSIIEDGLTVITNSVVIPHSGWNRNMDTGENRPSEIYWSTVFRNASGVLRNTSSAGEYSRKKLRECDGLVDALLHLVRAAIGKNDIDNKSVENCVCVLRNLSYRCQEVEDSNYDRHVPQAQSRAAAPNKGDNLGCFGASKKKKEGQAVDKQRKEPATATNAGASPRPRTEPVKGMELLWQPEVVQPYLALLSDCSNPETLEAAAGAIQNLAACYWQPSIDIRAAVRKEKGLPILVELLRMEVDRVVCAVATALRNLALDQRNKELIGKYAMRDLVQKLPSETQQHDTGTSDETVAAVLATLNEVIRKNAEFARSLLETGGVDRLMYITRQRGRFSGKVVKFASQVLYNLWQHQELREAYKKQGWRETNFITRTMAARSTSPSNINSTLNRPISTQGGTKYEDRTLQRSKELNAGPNRSPETRVYARDDVPLSDMKYPSQTSSAPASARAPVGGVLVFPTAAPNKPTGEPVYAQVNRDRKKNRSYDDNNHQGDGWNYDDNSLHGKSIALTEHEGQMGGDSWV
uniref:Catenin delta-2 n=1 Tax=Strigamia maritima TaxID=126957 RepID=T1IHH0_STRMM